MKLLISCLFGFAVGALLSKIGITFSDPEWWKIFIPAVIVFNYILYK